MSTHFSSTTRRAASSFSSYIYFIYCALHVALVIALLVVLSPGSSLAESSFPTSVSGNFKEFRSLIGTGPKRSALSADGSSSLKISANLFSYGQSTLTFDKVIEKNWKAQFVGVAGISEDTSPAVILHGQIQGQDDGNHSPITAIVLQNNGLPELRVQILDTPETANGNVYEVTIPLSDSENTATATTDVVSKEALASLGCDGGIEVPKAGPVRSALAAGISGELEIAADADFEWFQRHGENSANVIASYISAASLVYQRDLLVTLVPRTINVWRDASQPYTTTSASSLISQFRNYTNLNRHLGGADLYHLFSGKDFNGATAGLGYSKIVCSQPDYAYSISQFYPGANFLVFAHEIGHNLGASHDRSPTIMSAAVTMNATGFASNSINQIRTVLASQGSCLTATSTTPIPPPPPVDRATLRMDYNRGNGTMDVEIGLRGLLGERCVTSLQSSQTADFARIRRKTISSKTKVNNFRLRAERIPAEVRLYSRDTAVQYFRVAYSCSRTETPIFSNVVTFDFTATPGARSSKSSWVSRATRLKAVPNS